MILNVFIVLLINITLTWGDDVPQAYAGVNIPPEGKNFPIEKLHIDPGNREGPAHVEEAKVHEGFVQSVIDISKDVNSKSVVTTSKSIISSSNDSTNGYHKPSDLKERVQSGALLRGFFVVLGITVLLLVYLGVRMFRLGKGKKPPAMVRKYGILTNRADVEMLPLPLSEDEDDDTVFELNNHINNR